jgi:hypothetical protein
VSEENVPGRRREHRSPAVLLQDLEVRVESHLVEVGHHERGPFQSGPADQRRLASDGDLAQLGEHGVTAAVRRTHVERLLLLVELHDRAAVGPGEAHRVGDDQVEDLVGVQAGADRLADLAQGLELGDLAGQLGAA